MQKNHIYNKFTHTKTEQLMNALFELTDERFVLFLVW